MTALYDQSLAQYRQATAEMLGCRVEDFASNDLAVVERPADSTEKYVAMLLTFGSGTVVSVEPEYLDLARTLDFGKHYNVFLPQSAILPIVAAAETRGEQVVSRGPGLGFLLGAVPDAVDVPAGLRMLPIDRDLREKWEPTGHFANALGDETPGAPLWRRGLALVTPGGEPAAVTGVWEDRGGHLEIGLDVVREHRGRGLARVITALMVRSILDEGAYPSYYCAATNVRSHRTALACGFVPTLSHSVIRRKAPAPPATGA